MQLFFTQKHLTSQKYYRNVHASKSQSMIFLPEAASQRLIIRIYVLLGLLLKVFIIRVNFTFKSVNVISPDGEAGFQPKQNQIGPQSKCMPLRISAPYAQHFRQEQRYAVIARIIIACCMIYPVGQNAWVKDWLCGATNLLFTCG